MGNQLAAATAVNVADVSSSLQLVAPLGGQHRNYFRSFHCVKAIDASNPAELLRTRRFFANASHPQLERQPQPRPVPNAKGGMDVVVKVFVRTLEDVAQRQLVERCYDHLLELDQRISRSLTRGEVLPCNLLFYSGIEVQNDRFCMLQRPFVAFSLAERLATRPYWSYEARLFAGFQLLQALVQLHERWETVHGDLKTDNVLLDASGWLYITDLCPFKPAFLPANNPALFDYYYDNNETRICLVDPDKFVDQPLPFNTHNTNATAHTAAMDIFSAACVLAHIFTEEPLFCLSDVLGLRATTSQTEREAMVDCILKERHVPLALRRMLVSMLCTPASSRRYARQVLEDFTPSVFPPHFAFLYNDILAPLLARPPDQQAQLLRSRLDDILDEAHRRCYVCYCPSSTCVDIAAEANATLLDHSNIKDYDTDARRTSVTLLLPVILHAAAHAATAEGTCRAVSVLQRVLPHCQVDVQTDAVLPHVLHYVRDERHPVIARVLFLRVLAAICDSAPSFASSEVTVFDDLVLPCVEELVSKADGGALLLAEVAEQLPRLLLLAMAHLEQRQALASATAWRHTFGAQRNELLDRGWDTIRSLFKHSDTNVVVAALRRTMDVARFLGEERTQDDLIPFLTTAITSAIEVQRELYPQAIVCHLTLQDPRLKTLRFFVDEGLRQTDTTCLHRTIESVTAVVEHKSLAVGDTMALVHQALPHILSPNAWIRAAACRLVEVAAKTNRVSDVFAYLECALRPLLRHPVPLASISSFPTALKLELAYSSTEQQPMYIHSQQKYPLITRLLGGNAETHDRITQRTAKGRVPHYTVPYYVANRSLHGLVPRLTLVDVSFDPVMLPLDLRPNNHNGAGDDNNGKQVGGNDDNGGSVLAKDENPTRCGETEFESEGTWRFFHLPSARERKRLHIRQSDRKMSISCDGVVNPTCSKPTLAGHTPLSIIANPPSDGFFATGRRHAAVSATAPSAAKPERELQPTAAPWFTQSAHLGGIYSTAAGPCGTLVTAGSRGEAMVWSLSPAGVDYAHRLQTDASPRSTFLFTRFLHEGASPLLSMGGTDGVWRTFDLERNAVVTRRPLDADGAALTATCVWSPSVALIATATGALVAVDTRAGRDVWGAAVPSALGAPSGLSPLLHESRAYGAVAVTLGGAAALFDLRFQLLLREYHIEAEQGRPTHAILCACPDVGSCPGLLLGTRAGTVHRLNLATGEVAVALQPATTGRATRAVVPQRSHGVLLTAGDDRWIRKWCLNAPAQSRTLACPPYVSPPYVGTTRGYITEVQSQQQQHTVSAAELYAADPPVGTVGSVPQHHKDAILTLCFAEIRGKGKHLVSGARDGTLTVWFNAE